MSQNPSGLKTLFRLNPSSESQEMIKISEAVEERHSLYFTPCLTKLASQVSCKVDTWSSDMLSTVVKLEKFTITHALGWMSPTSKTNIHFGEDKENFK